MSESYQAEGLEAVETTDTESLQALQLERLRWSVGRAYERVEPYRAKCVSHGVHPDALQSLADLTRFPFTAKQDLREHYPFGLFAVPTQELVRIHASSGTTGKPTVVGYTQNDIDIWAALVARAMYAAGCRDTDILHNALGYGLFTGGLGYHYGAERLGMAVVPVSGGQSERQVQLLMDFGATVIGSTPSYLLALAEEFDRQGIDSRSTKLRIAMLGAEPWTERDANRRSRRAWALMRRSSPMDCPKSSAPGWLRNAWRPRTGPPSGRIISTRKSSIRRPVWPWPMARKVSWYSPL